MRSSLTTTRALHAVAIAGIVCALSVQTALATLAEPVPRADWRDLRPGAVKAWYIFSDANSIHGQVNGILDPGDKLVASFKNWWTPVSASTQHNYTDGPYGAYNEFYRTGNPNQDMPSGPMNFASATTPGAENYWLPRMKNAVQFYMTHSQFDNNDWGGGFTDGQSGDVATILQQRNVNRNGWALGWLTNDLTQDASGHYVSDQTVGGKVKMDVFVHDGKNVGTYVDSHGNVQATRSNPQVSLSNDVDNYAQDSYAGGGQWHPPVYDDTKVGGADKGYTWEDNRLRFEHNGLIEAEFHSATASMEVFETDPYTLAAGDVVVGPRRPDAIRASLTDGHGNAYTYDDAFLQRNPDDLDEGAAYDKDSSDGGVIAGLGGYDYYNPFDLDMANDWGEQQVIRIDFDPSVFQTYDAEGNPTGGSIDKVIFWDFGYAPGAGQLSPIPIELDLSDLAKFPDHRFYIAAVIPEPATLSILATGALACLGDRRRRRPAAR